MGSHWRAARRGRQDPRSDLDQDNVAQVLFLSLVCSIRGAFTVWSGLMQQFPKSKTNLLLWETIK